MRDFRRTQTDELLRQFRFHENDRGTMTMAEECRRMSLVDQIGAELSRRGVNPFTGNFRPYTDQVED